MGAAEKLIICGASGALNSPNETMRENAIRELVANPIIARGLEHYKNIDKVTECLEHAPMTCSEMDYVLSNIKKLI